MSSPSSIVGRKEISAIKPSQKFEGHRDTDSVDTIIQLPDGQRMMTCSRDGSLRVWNVKSGKQIGEDYRDPDGDDNIELRTIALSPDGKKVVSGSLNGGMRLWDIDTGKVIGKWTGHTATVRSVCWSRDGRRVVSGSDDGTARQWDVENGETILGPIKTGHTNVYAVVYSPDMTMFATAGCYYQWDLDDEYEDSIKIWQAKTGELVATLNGHTQMVNCLAWTPDGKTLISGSNDCSIRTWDTTTWKQIALLKNTDIVYAIAISPNGRILASASFYMTSQLWNLDNNQPIGPPLQYAPVVACLSFSPDGKLLATSGGHNAYTWDVTVILKEAGLDDLLLDQPDKSLLTADATRRRVRQPIKIQNRVPRGFFDDTLDHARLSERHCLQPLSPSHGTTLRNHFLSLFRPIHSDAHDTPSRPRPFHWVRNRLSGRSSGPVDIELHKHPSAVIDVPYAKGKRRNACAREKRRPVPKNPSASTSRPPNSNPTQQSNGTAQAQPSSQTQSQAANPTSSATPEATTSLSTNPHATIKHAGRWTRFWLFVCCASPEYTDGHH